MHTHCSVSAAGVHPSPLCAAKQRTRTANPWQLPCTGRRCSQLANVIFPQRLGHQRLQRGMPCVLKCMARAERMDRMARADAWNAALQTRRLGHLWLVTTSRA
mmetsp:Transcript_28564/g.84546  ORF Transcript_28564/g.84546 Transcript_28564/m.84546 type:complete len:103 (-) Transcript_28564:4986-5294(-)